MTIYIFVSGSAPGIQGFTEDEAGSNLPIRYAPWKRSSSGTALYLGKVHDSVTAAVTRDGYFLVLSEVERRPPLAGESAT
jgi:hypothetical protein